MISEADFLANVVQLATTLGWLVHHDRPARRGDGSWATHIQGDPGFPDLVLARGGRAVFAELKSETGRTTASQRAWISALTPRDGLGPPSHEVYLWRPQDMDQIAKVLGP